MIHSFLLIGQSNMAGRGYINEAESVDMSYIKILRNGRWQPMFRPINPDRSFSGVNLAESFAEKYAKEYGVDVGLICCADGGTSLEQWKKGSLLFENAVYNARLAQRTSVIAGVLWHQGEADCSDELHITYKTRFEEFMEALRNELDLYNVPFLLGGLGDFLSECTLDEKLKNYIYVNEALEKIACENSMTGFVSAKGLGANPDNLHFNSKALYEFGLRYFDELKKFSAYDKQVSETYQGDDMLRTGMERLYAEEKAIDVVYNKNSSCYKELNGLFLDDVASKCASSKTTRYSYSKDAVITYSPKISTEGNYAVYYWNSGSMDNRNQQDFFITSNDGEANVKLNLKGNKGWKYLGVYSFSPNGPIEVKLTRDLYGGAIRSGSLRLIKTDKQTHVAYSQEPKTTAVRDYPDGNGIVITNRIMKSEHVFSGSVSLSTIALVNAEGRAMKYTNKADAIMSYTPKIPEAGEYHVMYWMYKQSASETTDAVPINVYHADDVTNLTINGLEHNGWVYLGKYNFKEGSLGGLETVNPEGARMYSGGAYFVSVNDEEFDPSVYASIDSPGSKKGATANEAGDYIIYTNSTGYAETGILGGFTNDGFNLDCDNRYSRRVDGANYPLNTMMYTADIAEKGSYEVFYYIIDATDNPTEQKILINTSDGVVETVIDCTTQSGWVSLGEYKFCGKINATVTTPTASSGVTRSGGVKFVNKHRCLEDD